MKRKREESSSPVKSIKSKKLNHTPLEPKLVAKPDLLKFKLNSAMLYANYTCYLGASNKAPDIKKGGWLAVQKFYQLSGHYLNAKKVPFTQKDVAPNIEYSKYRAKDGDPSTGFFYTKRDWYYHLNQPFTNHPEINLIPYAAESDPLANSCLSDEHILLLKKALLINQMRYGNCESRSILVASWLWKHSVGIHRIEIVFFYYKYNHAFVVVNRTGDNWENGWVIDPWWGKEGIIYPAKEFGERLGDMQEYLQSQAEKMQKLGKPPTFNDDKNLTLEVAWEIYPEKDIYPTFCPYKSLEDYYYVSNVYPDDIIPDLGKLQATHKEKFEKTLAELKEKAPLLPAHDFKHNTPIQYQPDRFFAPKIDFCEVGEQFDLEKKSNSSLKIPM